jgi:RecA-family ATPase
MVVIDTLARTLVGGDENSAKDVGMFFYHTDIIREQTHAAIWSFTTPAKLEVSRLVGAV